MSYVQSSCNQPASLILSTNCAASQNSTYSNIYTFVPPNNQIDFDLTTQSCAGRSVLMGTTQVYFVIEFPPSAKQQSITQQQNQTASSTSKVQASSAVHTATGLLAATGAAAALML